MKGFATNMQARENGKGKKSMRTVLQRRFGRQKKKNPLGGGT